MPLVIASLYLGLHAGLYFLVLRERPLFGTQNGIFAYHFVSAIGFSAAFAAWALATGGPDRLAWLTAAVMLHGIYSLSFLELWALADDSYSLAILLGLHRSATLSDEALRGALEAIARHKQASRLHSLERLCLVRPARDGRIGLTGLGRAAVTLGRALMRLADISKHG
jgi:hypothetical protein